LRIQGKLPSGSGRTIDIEIGLAHLSSEFSLIESVWYCCFTYFDKDGKRLKAILPVEGHQASLATDDSSHIKYNVVIPRVINFDALAYVTVKGAAGYTIFAPESGKERNYLVTTYTWSEKLPRKSLAPRS
jgi:hypothetical protein